MLSGDCPTALTTSIISIETVVRPTGLFRCNQRKCKSRNAFTTQKYGLRKTRDKALVHSGTWRKTWLIMGLALIANSESTHDIKPRVSPVYPSTPHKPSMDGKDKHEGKSSPRMPRDRTTRRTCVF